MEEVDGLCAGDVTQAFFTMLRGGADRRIPAGCGRAHGRRKAARCAGRRAARAAALAGVRHAACARTALSEPVDAVQGKLCLMFTAGTPLAAAQLSAMRVAVALLGGTTTSRLFVNVREKPKPVLLLRGVLLCHDGPFVH